MTIVARLLPNGRFRIMLEEELFVMFGYIMLLTTIPLLFIAFIARSKDELSTWIAIGSVIIAWIGHSALVSTAPVR